MVEMVSQELMDKMADLVHKVYQVSLVNLD